MRNRIRIQDKNRGNRNRLTSDVFQETKLGTVVTLYLGCNAPGCPARTDAVNQSLAAHHAGMGRWIHANAVLVLTFPSFSVVISLLPFFVILVFFSLLARDFPATIGAVALWA